MAGNFEVSDGDGTNEQPSAAASFAVKAYLVRGDIIDSAGLDHATATQADLGTANMLLALGEKYSGQT